MTQTFTDFNQWTEVTKGLYRNVFCAGACYEIIVMYWAETTPIETAKANLYVTGEWSNESGGYDFTRELLLEEEPFYECMVVAQKDYDENVK